MPNIFFFPWPLDALCFRFSFLFYLMTSPVFNQPRQILNAFPESVFIVAWRDVCELHWIMSWKEKLQFRISFVLLSNWKICWRSCSCTISLASLLLKMDIGLLIWYFKCNFYNPCSCLMLSVEIEHYFFKSMWSIFLMIFSFPTLLIFLKNYHFFISLFSLHFLYSSLNFTLLFFYSSFLIIIELKNLTLLFNLYLLNKMYL